MLNSIFLCVYRSYTVTTFILLHPLKMCPNGLLVFLSVLYSADPCVFDVPGPTPDCHALISPLSLSLSSCLSIGPRSVSAEAEEGGMIVEAHWLSDGFQMRKLAHALQPPLSTHKAARSGNGASELLNDRICN